MEKSKTSSLQLGTCHSTHRANDSGKFRPLLGWPSGQRLCGADMTIVASSRQDLLLLGLRGPPWPLNVVVLVHPNVSGTVFPAHTVMAGHGRRGMH